MRHVVMLLCLTLTGCPREPLPDISPPPNETVVAPSGGRTASAPPSSSVEVAKAAAAASSTASAPAVASGPAAGASAEPVASAAKAVEAPVDPQNKAKPPLESEELTAVARSLFEAIKADDPTKAAGFFFPREPFLVLKDIKNPGKYWDHLFHVYEKDIHDLHRKQKQNLEGAEFVSFALGSAPGWVKPGEEGNKIGYYRTFNGKLRYRQGETQHTIEVRVIISWGGRWYITHLLPWKK